MDRIKPGSYNTQKLAAEAAAMEARLTALKLQLQKDKAQREAAAAAGIASALASGGKGASIWSNGQQGPLKRPPAGPPSASGAGRLAAAQPPAGPVRTPSARISVSSSSNKTQSLRAGATSTTGAAQKRSTRQAAAGQLAASPSAAIARPGSFRGSSRVPSSSSSTPSGASTRPTSTGSTSSSGSLDTKRSDSDTPTKAAAGKPQWLQQLRQQQESSSLRQPSTVQHVSQQGLSAQQVESWNQGAEAVDVTDGREQQAEPNLLDGAYDETQAASSFQEALLQWRQAGTTGSHTSSSNGGCGPVQHQEQSLLHGAYDESAAASSFQEALKQWRQAGPAADTTTSASTNASISVSASVSASASCAAGGSAMSSQAQQCTQQRSSSSSTGASTASGTGPTGRPINSSVAAFLQKLTTRTPSNNNAGPAGSSLLAVTDALPGGYPEAGAALQSLAGMDSQHAMASTHSSYTTGPDTGGVSCQEELPSTGNEHTSIDACDDFTADADVALTSEPFEAWLQQAEQTATMLSAAASHDTPCVPQTGHGSSGGQDAMQGAGMQNAGPSAAASMYYQKLEGMLQAVEQLESELQDRTVPVRLTGMGQ